MGLLPMNNGKPLLRRLQCLLIRSAWDIDDSPDKDTVIDSMWAFTLKQYPDGLVKNFKACSCEHGDEQNEKVHFFEM